MDSVETVLYDLDVKKMKKTLKWTCIAFSALVLGLGSALWMGFSVPKEMTIDNGPWRTSLAAGSEESGMYMRATVALIGLLALNKSEAVYFVARTDDEGRQLRSACDYRVQGGELDTRWWSITLYGKYTFFIPNELKRYSYNGANVEYGEDGEFTINISPEQKKGNWLPSGDESRLHITLRLYNPGPAVYDHPGEIELPSITRGECR
ncbi:DUF1214 domain-containing protein [bacterium]